MIQLYGFNKEVIMTTTYRNCCFSFKTSIIALLTSATLALSGCSATMPNIPQQLKDFLPLGLGGVAAVTCYKVFGGGNGRFLTGAACGVGAYFLTKKLQNNTDDKTAKSVAEEYQKALSARPDGPPFDYKIEYKDKDSKAIVIILNVENAEFSPSGTQCRSFAEWINDGARTNRRACRQKGNDWAIQTET